MNTATATQIKYVENSLEILNQLAIELELETILVKELESGLLSDVNSMI